MKKTIITAIFISLLLLPTAPVVVKAQTFSTEQENQIKAIIQQITDLQIQLLLARIAELQAQIAELLAKQTVVEQKVNTVITNTTPTPIPVPTPTPAPIPIQFSAMIDSNEVPTNRCIFSKVIGAEREYSYDLLEHYQNDGVTAVSGAFYLNPLNTSIRKAKLKAHLDTSTRSYVRESEQDNVPIVKVYYDGHAVASLILNLGRTDIEINDSIRANVASKFMARVEIEEIRGVVESQLTIDSMSIDGVEVLGLPIIYSPVSISLCQ